jgi:hypothetical protein
LLLHYSHFSIASDLFQSTVGFSDSEEDESAAIQYFMCAEKMPPILASNSSIVIKLYIGGGKLQKMEQYFKAAHIEFQRHIHKTIQLVTLDHSMIKKEWGATDEERLAALLGDSHAHYVLCHPHQQTTLNWHSAKLYRVLCSHLASHPGFPTGNQWRCSVYTQDKFGYMMEGITNPTLKIDCIEWLSIPVAERLNQLSR